MREDFDDVIRAAVALQTATYELHDSDIGDKQSMRAMLEIQKELNKRIKALLKEMT